MSTQPSSLGVLVVVPALSAVMTALAVVAVARARSWRAAAAFAAAASVWIAAWGALAAAGVLGRVDARPPPMALMIPLVLAMALGLGLSSLGGAVAERVPLGAIVLAQAFRLPLELAMHRAGADGLMPVELSFSGYNFDVLTGALSLVVGPLALRGSAPRWALVAWNAVGIAALSAIVVIAVASSPMLRLFGDDPRHVNTWVTRVPYVWLPTVLVVIAVASHVVATRRLLADRARAR